MPCAIYVHAGCVIDDIASSWLCSCVVYTSRVTVRLYLNVHLFIDIAVPRPVNVLEA